MRVSAARFSTLNIFYEAFNDEYLVASQRYLNQFRLSQQRFLASINCIPLFVSKHVSGTVKLLVYID